MARRILIAFAALALTGGLSSYALGISGRHDGAGRDGMRPTGFHAGPDPAQARSEARRASRSRCVEAPLSIGSAAVPNHGRVRVQAGEAVFVELVEAERYLSWSPGEGPPPRPFPWLAPQSSDSRILKPMPTCPQRGISSLPVHISAFRAVRAGTARLTAPLAPSWRAAKSHVRRGLRAYRSIVVVTGRSRPRRLGTLAGSVQLCGGPAPGRCKVETMGSCQPPEGCVSSDSVLVRTPEGARVAQRRLQDARFHLRLRPGRYEVELIGGGKHVRGEVMERRQATVRAGHRTSVRFRFSIP